MLTKKKYEDTFSRQVCVGPAYPRGHFYVDMSVDYITPVDWPKKWEWGTLGEEETRILVKYQGRVIAYLILSFAERGEPYLCMLEVDPKYRNKGIGRALVKTVSGPCRACGVDNVEFWRKQEFDFDPENDLDMLRPA